MSTLAGLLFLFGGIALFVAGILLLVARERSGHKPRRSVKHFQNTRHALDRIHNAQVSLRDSSRARARAMHPSGRPKRGRRSA